MATIVAAKTMTNATGVKVTFAPWGATDASKPPRNATAEGAKTLKVKIDGKAFEVKENKSKAGTTYFYVEIEGKWFWSRGPVVEGDVFKPYVKPEPAPKEAKAPKTPKAATTEKVATAANKTVPAGTKTTAPAATKPAATKTVSTDAPEGDTGAA